MFSLDWVIGIGNDTFDNGNADASVKFGMFKDIGSFAFGIERLTRDGNPDNVEFTTTFVTMKYNL